MRDPFNIRGREVFHLRGWRLFLLRVLVVLFRLYYASLRMKVSPRDAEAIRNAPQPKIFLVWHNRSLVAIELFRRFFCPERICCLISPSQAAAWEAAFFDAFGFQVARGSSSRRGIQATREMVQQTRGGNDVGISPDGPSGPLYSFQRGALALGRLTGTPFLILNANCRWALRLPSWDRHLIPLPFSRVDVRVEQIPQASIDLTDEALACEELRRRCRNLVDE